MSIYPHILLPVQNKDKAKVTHSIIEFPKPRNQCSYPLPKAIYTDKVTVDVLTATLTLETKKDE